LALFASLTVLTGCSTAFNTPTTSSVPHAGAALAGAVHGGQQPITGSRIYLFAAGTTGYASTPTSLLNTSLAGVSTDSSGNGYVTSGASGNWTISNDYTCLTPGSLVYLQALGGNPGLGPGTNNNAIALVAALGPCSSLTSSTFININEVTTVASAYALSPFATPVTVPRATFTGGIATSATNLVGLTNAFATVPNIVDLSTGQARTVTPGGLGHIPQQEINSLANILSVCVNSSGSTGECLSLFNAVTPSGGTIAGPSDTWLAILDVARHPGLNVHAIYLLQPSSPPFQPVLPVPNPFSGASDGTPNDWSIAVTYASSAWSSPQGIAADSHGNIWLVSGSTVAKLDPAGNQLETVTGGQIAATNNSQAIAIDLNDNALVEGSPNWISLVDPMGNNTTLADPPPPFSGPFNIQAFGGVVVDASNNYWAGNAANAFSSLVTFNASSGTGVNATFTGGGLFNPAGLAIDYAGSIWVTNPGSPSAVSKFSSAGVSLAGSTGFTTGPLSGAAGIAIDSSGNAWVASPTGNFLTQLSSSGTPSPLSPWTGGGLAHPSDIAIDGDGFLWVSNLQQSTVSERYPNGAPVPSPPIAYYNGLTSGQSGHVIVDASGNVWLSDLTGYFDGSTTTGAITQMVGLGAPTTTPIALALKNHTIGTRP
jgi:sugar lactone lactonase YvrE